MGGMIAPFLVAIAVTAQTASLTFTKPPAWTDRAAGSSMRVAEFVVRVVMPSDLPDQYVPVLERVVRSCPAHNTLAPGTVMNIEIVMPAGVI